MGGCMRDAKVLPQVGGAAFLNCLQPIGDDAFLEYCLDKQIDCEAGVLDESMQALELTHKLGIVTDHEANGARRDLQERASLANSDRKAPTTTKHRNITLMHLRLDGNHVGGHTGRDRQVLDLLESALEANRMRACVSGAFQAGEGAAGAAGESTAFRDSMSLSELSMEGSLYPATAKAFRAVAREKRDGAVKAAKLKGRVKSHA